MSLKERYQKIIDRCPKRTCLIAVSKTRTVDEIVLVQNLGQTAFGENKVQELLEKSQKLKNIEWHFIGHLQSNKINQLLSVENLVSIHSIDSLSLLKKILKKEGSPKIGLFLQINTSRESEKGGFDPEGIEELTKAITLIRSHPSFFIEGLMTIGKIRTENFSQDAKECFALLTKIKAKLDKDHSLDLKLSMGMSQDYEIAIEMGSHFIRVGSDIFGARV